MLTGITKNIIFITLFLILPGACCLLWSPAAAGSYLLFLAPLLVLIGLWRTVTLKSRQTGKKGDSPGKNVVYDGAAARLSKSIAFKTVSYGERSKMDFREFREFLLFLKKEFPFIETCMTKTVIDEHNLVFRWKGRDSSLKPVLLLAHYDVVPAEEQKENWSFPPFSGAVEGGYIWGRGAMDDKSSLMALLEAAEELLKNKYVPAGDIYLAFGHDEETGGAAGAGKIAAYFEEQGLRFEWALDEGLVITEGIMPDISAPVAFVGVAEKGYLTLSLTARGESGHSSMPPGETAIYVLSRALNRLKKKQFKSTLNQVVRALFRFLAPEMSFLKKFIFANMWLTSPLVEKVLAAKSSTNALIRTTMAPTVLRSGEKENVLPHEARGLINLRLLPGQGIEQAIAHVKQAVKKLPVTVKKVNAVEFAPSKVSEVEAPGFAAIHKTINRVFPGTVVAPSMALAGSDSRHYAHLCSNIYRFIPLCITKEDTSRFHGINERISLEAYHNMITFYSRIIKNR